MIKKLTLCIVHKPLGEGSDRRPKVLLGMKKRGFGVGRWNGFGGKVEAGETIKNAAKREVFEESGIRVAKLTKLGQIEFEFAGDPEILQVHIFKATDFKGQPAETGEMKPAWFHIDKIPLSKMWPDDKYWLPLFLKDKKFKGRFLFSGQNKITDYKLELI